ncbi:MAG: ribosome biogenesis GTPase Der [Alphaproteobacteria bacterium]
MPLVIAIIGRPNVGKSTLFNRLIGQRLALVDDRPGVTRDWREGEGKLGRLSFTVIDTAGLEVETGESLAARMQVQTAVALDRADLVLMLIDGRAGVTPLDRHFVDMIRRRGGPVVLVVNKAEGKAADSGALESFEFGLGDPVEISAAHGLGMGELADAIAAKAPEAVKDDTEDSPDGEDGPVRIAIVGRPNTGKSTLLNRLIGSERVLTGPEPGVTRDAIAIPWVFKGQAVQLVDTAGMRRRTKIEDRVEKLAVGDTLRSIRFANVTVLVVDATAPMERQELTIANHVINEGRALVIALNNWDLIASPDAARRGIEEQLEIALAQVRGVATVTLSALTGKGVDGVIRAALKAYEIWNRRISTARLNNWLSHMLERHPPPMVSGRNVKIRYATQTGARPPTFAFFVNRPAALPAAYKRYLINDLRETFKLPGTPIRLMLRAGRNPYDKSTGGTGTAADMKGKGPRPRRAGPRSRHPTGRR